MLNDEKVYLKCQYIYEKNGKEKSAFYLSPKLGHNLTNPNIIIMILRNEIWKEKGHEVKTFLMVGKEPAASSTLN